MAAITPDEIIALLTLKPLPVERGVYAEMYKRFVTSAPSEGNPTPPSRDSKPLSTAIYYLLTPETFSALHRLPGDEVYHFYLGDPVELLILAPDGSAATHSLGSALANGESPQFVAPGGAWQGSALSPGGTFALMGTTMTPGFHHDDFELGDRADLSRRYPAVTDQIRRLTR